MTRGRKVAGILYYLYGPGKQNEHRDPHLVAAWRDPADLEPRIRPSGKRDYGYLCGLLDQTVTALGPYNHAQPVWHCSLRAAPEDPILTDDQWAQIAGELMHGMGLAPYGDHGAVRWVAVRHADDHIHIVTTLAREDGTRPDIWRDYDRVMNVCRMIEARHGLRVAPAGDRTAPKTAGRAEAEKAIRLGRADPPKDVIKRLVTTAAAGARSETDFFERLAESGLLVRQRHSKDRSGRAEGYAVTFPGHTDASGEPIWYGGYRLAADLSLPKLRARWPGSGPQPAGGCTDHRTAPGPVSAERLSERTARVVLRKTVADAADQSADEAEFFGRLTDRGLLLRTRYSEVNFGEVTGYAVALPGRTRPDGQPDWCGGSHLADRLSLQKLRERWGSARSYEQSSAERFTFEERQGMYDDAARAAAYATDQIRRFGRFDPARAADAAWAASDVLHTAAKALGNPHLRARRTPTTVTDQRRKGPVF